MSDLTVFLKRYAELLTSHGLNVQKGQIVNIVAETVQREVAFLVAEAAYSRGAKFVNIDLIEPRATRLRILHSESENLEYVPDFLGVKFRELVDQTGANIRFVGSEYPELLADLPARAVNTVRVAQRKALRYYFDQGIGKSLVHWTVAAGATPEWAQKIFPGLEPKAAEERLWQEIFKICRVDNEDFLEFWKIHNLKLKKRADLLTSMKLKEIHFLGPNTDLTVGLSDKAIFKGGSEQSPRGVEFEPNIPTEEVFTSPDWRKTTGHVQTTRPFLINGKLIKGLRLDFKDGEIISFSAEDGKETFREYINSDEGAKRLGEVALVGIDSPIYQSGLVFEEILFDENAACHIAIGSAYKFCLQGGESMNEEQLKEVGCNESTAHTDMMISSDEVDVYGTTFAGERIALQRKGQWVC